MSKLEDALHHKYDPGSDLEIVNIEYDPHGNPNSANAEKNALINNLLVVYPEPNQLLIDIDNDHNFMLFNKQLDIVEKFIGVEDTVITTSRNGLPGRHITVTLSRDVTELERIALQACLGSDRVRELLGFVQNDNGDPHPTLFLEKKPELLLTDGNFLTDEEIPY